MGLTIKIPARRPPTLPQRKRKLSEDLKARPSKRPHPTSPFHPHDWTDQSYANVNRGSSLPPTRRKTHTHPNSHSDHPRSGPPPTQQGPSTTEVDPTHSNTRPPPPSRRKRTFEEIVELLLMGERFATFPLELSRLEFVRVPFALGGTQTLSVEADEGWRMQDEAGRAEKEVVVRERGSMRDGENVGHLGDPGGPNSRDSTAATNNGCVRVGSLVEMKVTPAVTRPITRSMTRKMELANKGGGLGDVEGAPSQTAETIMANSIEVKAESRVADRGWIDNSRSTRLPPFVAHSGVYAPIQPTFAKCTTPFASLPVHLQNGLPFTTPAELTTFLHSEPPSEISKFIESIRERHLWTFALRHSHVLQSEPRLPTVDFHPPPPPCVAKINALRVRLENLTAFTDQLRTSQNDIPFAQSEFLYLERARLEVEIEGLGLEWYRLLAKYVGEYDELVTWLRLQAPIETSGAKSAEEVKVILAGEMKRVRVTREEDIQAAIERFVGWADAQYDAMRREEVTLRWWALRMWFAKGAYRAEPSKRPFEKGGEGGEVDDSRGEPLRRVRVEDLAERAGF